MGLDSQLKLKRHNGHQPAARRGRSNAEGQNSNESTAQICYSPPDVALSYNERPRPLASETCHSPTRRRRAGPPGPVGLRDARFAALGILYPSVVSATPALAAIALASVSARQSMFYLRRRNQPEVTPQSSARALWGHLKSTAAAQDVTLKIGERF